MTFEPPQALVQELDALGPAGRRRAASAAASMFAADVSAPTPALDPVPVVLDADAWEELSTGLVQRVRLLDALYADLYGPRTVLGADVAPVGELLQDPAYLRSAVSIPTRGNHHLFAVTSTVTRTTEGSWVVLEDAVDVPDAAGTTLALRRALSRSVPTLYRSTALRRLHPFFDAARTALHQRTRTDGRAGRTVVLMEDSEDSLQDFDHSWLANLLGAPVVSVGDLRSGAGTLTLRLPGLDADAGDAVDAVLRLVPSPLLDPLDLGPTPLGGVTGLVEAARCGDVEIFNPIGAGLLENPSLHAALPDLCRQMLHEDLLLRPAPAGARPAGWLGLDPAGGDELVERPVRIRLLVMATEDGYEVLPGGIAHTIDDGPETLKDVWVTVPETSAVPGQEDADAAEAVDSADLSAPPEMLTAYPAMTRSIGSDLFWFGRYLERVDLTARVLRTVLDISNDLDAEGGPSAATARSVLLGAVTEVTTTYPGFQALDVRNREAVRAEIEGLLTDLGRPGSLAQSYAALAHTTRTLRDLVSDDVWPVIARMRQRLRILGGIDAPPLEQGLTEIVDGCLTLSGAVADSMPRTVAWDLTEVGRKIERTLGLLTLLRATLGRRRTRAAESRIAGALALITESGAAYRRAYHAAVQPELLVELLQSDATLPRSLVFQLDRLTRALDRLPETSPSPELRAPLTALRSRLSSWEPRELLRPLDREAATSAVEGAPTALLGEADAATASLRELAVALENRYFRPSESTSRWGVDDV